MSLNKIASFNMSKKKIMETKSYLCYGPLIWVLKLSRFFGVAPLKFRPEGIRFSKAYYIYSLVFTTAFKSIILTGFVLGVSNPEQSLRARTTSSRIIWLAYQTVLTAVTVVGCFEAPARCSCMLEALDDFEKMNDILGGVSQELYSVKGIYATMFTYFSALIILSFMDLFQNINAAYRFKKEVKLTSMFSLFYFEYLIELLLEFQFMLIVFRLTEVLKEVNKKLKNILQEMVNKNKKVVSINNYISPKKTIISYSFRRNYEDSSEVIRTLALVYELVSEVVRRVDRGYSLILLLLLQSFFLHFIMTPYYMISQHRVADEVASIGQQVAWFHFHAANVILIVEPCHRVQVEMAITRSLVTKLLCHADPATQLSCKLSAFFKTLTLDRPIITPCGMSVLERPLLITILGVVSAYLVPRHYFTLPQSKHVNTTNFYPTLNFTNTTI